MRQIISIGVVLVVLLLALVACASPADSPSEPAAVSNASQPEAEMAEEVSADASEEMAETDMEDTSEDVVEAEIEEVEIVEETGPTAQEIAQMERAAAGTIRDNERAGNRQVSDAEAADDEIRSLASFLPDLGEAPEVINGEPWINSDPLTLEELEGKVVLIEFWTYS